MIGAIIPLLISLILSTVSIVYNILNYKKLYTAPNYILNIISYLIYGFLFFLFFYLSTEILIPKEISLIFWKLSLIMRMIYITLIYILYNLTINNNKLHKYPLLILSLLAGLIISLLSSPDSIIITASINYYIHFFNDPYLLVCLIIYDVLIIFFIIDDYRKNYSNISYKNIENYLTITIIIFIFIILLITFYIITNNFFFADISNLIYIISSIMTLYQIIKHHYEYTVMSNEISDFIIFHKSGILLFSYNFETRKETDESLLKGSILIGINHILSKLIDKKAQLNLIKLENRDLVFQYDINHGYAVLLIANQKNRTIDKAVKNFMTKFNEMNEESLKKIEQASMLIDISQFKNAKELIKEYFKPYI